MDNELCLGGDGNLQVNLNARMANRHGLIAGATGTGKTVTLQVMAEAFSRIGVPVFMADVKGDLSGLAQPGKLNDKIQSRLEKIGLANFSGQPNPVLFWDIFHNNSFCPHACHEYPVASGCSSPHNPGKACHFFVL